MLLVSNPKKKKKITAMKSIKELLPYVFKQYFKLHYKAIIIHKCAVSALFFFLNIALTIALTFMVTYEFKDSFFHVNSAIGL